MKSIVVNERPDVQVPDFLLRACKAQGIKSFNLLIANDTIGITLHVDLEKPTKFTGEAHIPETYEGIANITIVL